MPSELAFFPSKISNFVHLGFGYSVEELLLQSAHVSLGSRTRQSDLNIFQAQFLDSFTSKSRQYV